MPEFFAQMLAEEMITTVIVEKFRESGGKANINDLFETTPIARGVEGVAEQKEKTSSRLKSDGLFSHPEPKSGSIFRDYKIMRDQAFIRVGQRNGQEDPEKAFYLGAEIILRGFCPEMTTDEALEKAREFVLEWGWQQ